MSHATQGRARYRRILRFFAWQLAIMWWYEIALPKVGLMRVADRTRDDRMRGFARSFREIAVDLGGLMIKLGQFLSSRLDVLPPELTKELEGLQDEVPAVPFEQIRRLAEEELGFPVARVFATVDDAPVAAASLGQVYRATLNEVDAAHMGFTDVVIKVQRPGIDEIVAVDLAAMRRVAAWLMRLRAVRRRVDMLALVEEFAQSSREEIDYLHEAGNAERFAECFAGDVRVRVPQVVWERTTRRVLTLEDVSAIKISDLDGLRRAGISSKDVASVFVAVMLDQFFVHSFFHGDPHPGNLFVIPGDRSATGDWQLAVVDFGMMGEVPHRLRGAARSVIVATAQQNGRGIVDAMREAGVLLPSVDTEELERAMIEVFARFGGMGVSDLRSVDPREFRDFANEFSEVMLEMPFQMPESFLLIIRAVSLTSGVASTLDPEYNPWDSVTPYAQQLLRDEGGNLARDFMDQAGQSAQILWRLPSRVDSLLSGLEDGSVAFKVPGVERGLERVERLARRGVSAGVFGAMLLAGALVYGEQSTLGTVLMIASAVPGLHVLFGGRRPR